MKSEYCIKVFDSRRIWPDHMEGISSIEMLIESRISRDLNSKKLLNVVKNAGIKTMLFIHHGDVPMLIWTEVLQYIEDSRCFVVLYSSDGDVIRRMKRRFYNSDGSEHNGDMNSRIIWYDKSVPYNRNAFDEFGVALKLWSQGEPLDEAFRQAAIQAGEPFRKDLIAFKLLLDCALFLLDPDHEAFKKMPDEARKIVEIERGPDFWKAYWNPVTDFVKNHGQDVNARALHLSAEEEKWLLKCLRHMRVQLEDDKKPDIKVPLVQKYLASQCGDGA